MDAGSFTEGLALALLGRGVHAAGTRSLTGMAELTFYDTLVSVAAAEGARLRKAWIIRREFQPPKWRGDERIDLVVTRFSGKNEVWVSATELKWWRSDDSANSSNRRKDLVVDFLRAASVEGFTGVKDGAYVVLITTEAAWTATTKVRSGKDIPIASKIQGTATQKWSLPTLKDAPAIKNAVSELRKNVPLPSIFHTRLEENVVAPLAGTHQLRVLVWSVRKPQRSVELVDLALSTLFGPPKPRKTTSSADDGGAAPSAVVNPPGDGMAAAPGGVTGGADGAKTPDGAE